MSNVYILGSSLLSALESSDDIYSGETSPVNISILDQHWQFPYFSIRDHAIDSGEQRLTQITEKVVGQAIKDAGLGEEDLRETGLFVGSTSFSIFASEQQYATLLETNPDTSPLGLTAYEALTNAIRQGFMKHSESYTFHTACTSSVNALLYASKMIRAGQLKYAIIVGLEFFNETTLLGFHSLDLISKSRIQPFGSERDGIMLGEGCSAIVLGAKKPEHKKNAICIEGGFTMVDIDSMTAVKPDGSSIVSVIRNAFKNAGITAEQVTAIKLHGTASYANDKAESIGLRKIYPHTMPPLCALKPAIGHTLGACGTNEMVILAHYLDKGLIPGIPFDYPVDQQLDIPLEFDDRHVSPGYFLLNHFGFGGNNTALVISNQE